MKEFKKIISVVLIVSLVFSMSGVITLAESIDSENLQEQTLERLDFDNESLENESKEDLNVDSSLNLTETNDEIIKNDSTTDEVSLIGNNSVSTNSDIIDFEEEEESYTLLEEPEEDPEIALSETNQNIFDIASESNTDITEIESTNYPIDYSVSNTLLDGFLEENKSTLSNAGFSAIDGTNIASISDAKESNHLDINISSKSEINDLRVATISDIASNNFSRASLSEIIASKSQLFGGANIEVGKIIHFGLYHTISKEMTEPISWIVLSKDDRKAYLLSYAVIEVGSFNSYIPCKYYDTDIARWLDGDFYYHAFTMAQRHGILPHPDDGIRRIFIPGYAKLCDLFDDGWDYWNVMTNNDRRSKLRAGGTRYVLDYLKSKYTGDSLYWRAQDNYVSYWLYQDYNNTTTSIYGRYEHNEEKIQLTNTDIGIRPALYIDLTSEYWKNKRSKIKWNLNGAKFVDGSSWPLINEYVEGANEVLPNNKNLIPPNDHMELAGWIFNDYITGKLLTNIYSPGIPREEIPSYVRGDIEVEAVWQYKDYNITWDLSDGETLNQGTWEGDVGFSYYQYGTGRDSLPVNVNGPRGRVFDHWEIEGKKVTSIGKTDSGDKTIKAVYKNNTYNITWDLVDEDSGVSGVFNGEYPANYEYSKGIEQLPLNVIPPAGKVFDHWEIGGVATMSILTNEIGDKTIKAAYLDSIWFGTYPQNDETGTQLEPIRWRVIRKDNSNNLALLIADNVLYTKRFSARWSVSNYNYAWKLSEMRRWLNDTFKTNALPESQRNGVLSRYIDTVNQGNSSDQFHLLSLDEVNNFFVNNDSLKAKATNYAKKITNTTQLYSNEHGFASWWLRTKSVEITGMEEIINYNGEYSDTYADSVNVGVRPAFYLDLSSNIYRLSNNSIRFDLKGGSFKDGSKLWEEFTTYQGGQKLPDASNIIPPNDDTFIGWVISGDDNIITEIAPDQTGDLVLEAVYGSIWFGTYPQNDTTGVSKEPIKWRVLKQDGNEILLVSDKLLDNVSYNNERSDVDWEDSDIRNWLNTDFTDNTFTIDQINDGIITKTISTRNQPETQDKIFLLSDEEANIYSSDDERKAKPTLYAKNVSNGGSRIFVNNLGFSRYWLRTSAGYVKSKIVFDNGAISSTTTSFEVSEKNVGVRPAFYANLDSDIFRFSNNKLTWDLNGGKWKENSKLWEEMSTYQGGQKLPTADNLIAPESQEFLGWSYYGELSTISEIESDKTGNIILVANWSNHPYNITWDLKDLFTGVDGSWVGEEGPSTYTYGVGIPILPTNVVSNDPHRVFVRLVVIDGSTPSCITPKDIGNKTIVAVYKNVEYDITWDLEDGTSGNLGTWDGDHPTTYEYYFGMNQLPINVIGPTGREFDHWEKDSSVITDISPTNEGPITLKAVYKNINYDIYWSIGYSSWEDDFSPVSTYEYSVGLELPDGNANLLIPYGKRFSKWILKYEDGTIVDNATEISIVAHGKVEVIAEYDNITYNIYYVNEDSSPVSWIGTAGPSTYTYQTGVPNLPTNVLAPEHYEFDHWEIDDIVATGIGPNSFGDKIVIAIPKAKKYNITWHLDDILGQVGDWNGEAGKDTYTYGTEYILPTNITPPKATEFAGWTSEEYGLIATTCIPKYDTGNKDFYASYEPVRYNITWSLNGASIDESTYYRDDWYTYQMLMIPNGRIPLPLASQITNIPTGKEFSHWAINGARATAIEPGTMGDLTITLVLKGEDEHNITWDYGIGDDHWEFDGWIPPATFSEGVPVMIPDDSYLYRTPNGREIDYFLVNGVKSMEIDGNTDVVVVAVLKNKSYRIKYNLGTGHWDEDEGASTYTHGTEFTLPINIIPPRGQSFSHWEINGVATTSILPTDYGHKEYTAVYEIGTYRIYWDLQGSTIDSSYDLRYTYTYGEEIILPSDSLISTSDAREFDYWTVNGARMTSILPTYAESVVVSIHYVSYPITWDLGGGKILYYKLTSSYEKGMALNLPEASYIVSPKNYAFDYFTVNGTKATEISNTHIGPVTVKAIYKYTPSPTPTPTPYYPSGGGGGGGGGRGGGGGGGGGIRGGSGMQLDIPKVSEVATIKFINKKYTENETVWVYDPISNKFMLHIKTFDSEVPAMNGFFVIDREVETKVNGILTQVIVTDTYYFDSNGNMLTGWIHTLNDDKWYFFDNSKTINEGKMYVLGWYQIENKWYYFDIDGRMLVNTKTPDGLYVGADGAYVNTQTTNT